MKEKNKKEDKRYYIISGNASFGPYTNKTKAKKNLINIEEKTKRKCKIISDNELHKFIWGTI